MHHLRVKATRMIHFTLTNYLPTEFTDLGTASGRNVAVATVTEMMTFKAE